MPLLGRKSKDPKIEETMEERVVRVAAEQAERTAAAERLAEHVRSVTKWEYQVKRVGEDKQKGLLGSQRMEQLFNGEGAQGWELVTINEERATFKRPLPTTALTTISKTA
jgi:hypothetical protein